MKKKHIIRLLTALLLSPILLLVMVAVMLYLPPIQRWAVDKAVTYANTHTDYRISIQALRLSFPLDVELQQVNVSTQEDTLLLSSQQLVIDFNFSRIFQSEIGLDALDLYNTYVNTRNLIEAASVETRLTHLHLDARDINLSHHTVNVGTASLTDANVTVLLADSTETDTTASTPPDWTITLGDISLHDLSIKLRLPQDSTFILTDINQAQLTHGTLRLQEGRYEVEHFSILADSLCYGLSIDSLQLLLNNLVLDTLGVAVDTISVQTPNSSLMAQARVPWKALSTHEGGWMDVKAKASLGHTDIISLGKDVLPEGLSHYWPHEALQLNFAAQGNVDSLLLDDALLCMPNSFFAKAEGALYNLLVLDSLGANAQLEAQTANLDWMLRWQQLTDVQIPAMNLHAMVKMTDPNRMATDALLTSGKGRAHLMGNLDLSRMTYAAKLRVRDWQMQRFLPKDSLYTLALSADLRGTGTDWLNRHTYFQGDIKVDSLQYGSWQLGGMALQARLNQGKGTVEFNSDNAILGISACADALTDKKLSDAHFSLDLHRIDLHALRLSPQPLTASLVLHLEGESNISDTHRLSGNAQAIELTTRDTTFHPMDLHWSAELDPQHIAFGADAGDLDLKISSKQGLDSLLANVDRLNTIWQKELEQQQFSPGSLKQHLPSLNVRLFSGKKNPLSNILRFTTGYEFADVDINLRSSQEEGLCGQGHIHSLRAGNILLDTIRWDITHQTEGIEIDAAVCNNKRNPVSAFTTRLHALLQANSAEAQLDFWDAQGKQGVKLGAQTSHTDTGVRLHFAPLDPIIAYRHFTLNADNFIELSRQGEISALVDLLADDGTGLKLYTTPNEDAEQDISLSIHHLNIGELAQALPYMPDVRGFLGGDVHYMQQDSTLTISTDLAVTEFSYNDHPMGEFGLNAIYFPNTDGSHYIDAILSHNGVDISTLSANYAERKEVAYIDGDLDLTKVPLSLLEAFTPDNLVELEGYIGGSVSLHGTTTQPVLNGEILTQDMKIKAPEYNIALTVPDNRLTLTNNLLDLGTIEAYAAGKTPLTITGNVDCHDLTNAQIDMRIKADNYKLIDAPRTRHALAYGKVFVNLGTRIKGSIDDLKIRGSLHVLGSTDVSYVMKDSPLTVEDELADLVTFCDFSDTIVVEKDEATRRNIDAQLDINVDQSTNIHCILSDDGTDRINLLGGGEITMTYNMDNGIRLYGRYTIINGDMRYTLMAIPLNNFNISPNSYVEFNGNAFNPTLHISATERVKASVSEESHSRNVAFNVGVDISQTLEDLGLKFTIEAPEDLSVQNELTSLSDDERSRVAMTMLVTGMYISNNFSSGGFSYTNTLNSYLQSSINKLVGQAATGVDINLGIENSTSQTGGSTTDYNFSFAKRFWNNRFNVVIGGKVSSGKEAVNNGLTLINNISVEYNLDESATRYVRLFYDRNHQSIIEGELTEMGAGVVLHRKSNKLGDLFIFRSKKEEKK